MTLMIERRRPKWFKASSRNLKLKSLVLRKLESKEVTSLSRSEDSFLSEFCNHNLIGCIESYEKGTKISLRYNIRSEFE